MTAPLSRYLTRFSAPPPVVVVEAAPEPPAPAPMPLVMLTPDELEARLAAARGEAIAAIETQHAAEIAAMTASHAAALSDTLTAAREEWCALEGERLATLIATATADLGALLCERTVAVLRPWLAEAATARAKAGLGEAFDRLLSDAKNPNLRVCGPADLVDAMREARPDAAVTWSIAETTDVTLIADATRVTTRLGAALAELTTES